MSYARKKTFKRVLAIVLSVLISSSLPPIGVPQVFAETADYPNVFTFTVTDGTNPIEGANVKVYNNEIENGFSNEASTNAKGEVSFPDVTALNSELSSLEVFYTITKDGYEAVNGSTTLGDTFSENIAVALTKVTPQQATVSVSVSSGDASIELNGTAQTSVEVSVGTEVPVKITPAAGSYIKNISINGVVIDEANIPAKGQAYTDTVTVNSNITIGVEIIRQNTVSVSGNDGGSILVNGDGADSIKVDSGTEVDIQVKADEGYQIASVEIAGSPHTSAAGTEEYSTKTLVSNDIDISVTFVKVYTVTVTHTGNGTVDITPTGEGGTVTVETGTDVVINATPNANHRVSEVMINGAKDDSVTGGNNTGYNKTLTADKEYIVEITFAPNTYNLNVENTTNGTIKVENNYIEHGATTKVYLTPDAGYTVESVMVNDSPVTDIIRDSSGIYFTIKNSVSNQKVAVTFKEMVKGSASDVTVNSDMALRKNDTDTLFVIKKESAIVFATEKDGLRLYNDQDELVGGDEATKSVSVSVNCNIEKVQLYYQADGELYADWHEVDMEAVKVVVDTDMTTPKLTPTIAANANGYYNANVTFTADVEDAGDYSGIAKVEYWITCDSADTTHEILYEYQDGEIRNTYTNTEDIVVDASIYNSENVKVTLKVTDRAGNEETVDEYLKINSTAPTVALDITGTQNPNALEGYYIDERVLTITIVDREETFDAAAVASGIVMKANEKQIVVETSDIQWVHNGSSHVGTYKFTDDAKYEWSISYTNKAGKSNEGVIAPTDKNIYSFTIDNAKPYDLKVSYEPIALDTFLENITFGCYQAPVKVTIEAIDDTAGIEQFVYSYTIQNGASAINIGKSDVIVESSEIVREGNRASTSFKIPAQFRGYVSFDVTDKAGNSESVSDTKVIVVDDIAPGITVSYDNNNAMNGEYFSADRTATITIVEHNFNASNVLATVKVNEDIVDEYTSYLQNDSNWTHNGDTHVATIKYTDEAHYSFMIECTDMSGNANAPVNFGSSVAPTRFTLDRSAPTDLTIEIDDVSVVGTNSIAFDTFYANEIVVKLAANCDVSGIQSLKYQKVASVSEYNANGTWVEYNASKGVVVSPSEKFIIYFRAEDKAGNVSIINSTGIVVDNQKPVGETRAPEIDIIQASPNANGVHRGNVDVSLKVIDPKYVGADASADGYYSGLNKITYRIYAADTNAVLGGTLFERANMTTGAQFDADNLANSWSGKITIDATKFNSNNVVVEVTAIDNAGNIRTSSTAPGAIKIDTTPPIINVSYSNNSAEKDSYFNAARTATIVVTERNFDANGVKLSLTNTDGVIPALSDWNKTAGTENGDNTQWTATITYEADGDYEFGIGYSDLAGNACADVQYGNSVAPTKFTIDKTIPNIAVTYDNNEALNGNYYKEIRNATVVITEHNLDPNGADKDRIVVTMSASDDGKAAAIPTISKWSTNGDRHTATISYSADALYTFDIAVTDKAGNESADFAQQTFFVDKTVPSIEISGVANNSANNGDVIPVITYSDTNIDQDQVTITLAGVNRKDIKLDGSYEDIHNGRIFTFNNFAKEKEIDDIYTLTATLTDKAGNTSTETIIFSVNRFGSTYALSESTEALNGSYVQSPADVVIKEINADKLANIKITLFKNNETIILEDGVDYKINIEGGNGQWYQYTYTIFAKNFEDDGVYRVAVHSEDTAGNLAENTLDTKETEITFGVDKTKPNIIVTNLEAQTTYALENLTVLMSASDNLLLSSVSVYLDSDSKAYKTWTAEEIAEIVAANGEFTFDVLGDSTSAHNVKIVCVDAAGNEQIEEITDFFVTTNLFVRYYTNKPLFYGSIAGVILIAGLIVFLVVYKQKKNEEK